VSLFNQSAMLTSTITRRPTRVIGVVRAVTTVRTTLVPARSVTNLLLATILLMRMIQDTVIITRTKSSAQMVNTAPPTTFATHVEPTAISVLMRLVHVLSVLVVIPLTLMVFRALRRELAKLVHTTIVATAGCAGAIATTVLTSLANASPVTKVTSSIGTATLVRKMTDLVVMMIIIITMLFAQRTVLNALALELALLAKMVIFFTPKVSACLRLLNAKMVNTSSMTAAITAELIARAVLTSLLNVRRATVVTP